MKQEDIGWPINEVAEIKKHQFINLVAQLAGLRDLQYANDLAPSVIERAKKIVALNLPSNLMRGAAIFVDQAYGFPADKRNFGAPKWVTARELLPQNERGLLACTGFKEVTALEEKDVVVLVGDIPEHGLHAGMAGIIRELPGDDETKYLVEFGEPEDSLSQTVEVSPELLRTPRPGDLLENYRW